jgi:hypothetical protein
MYRMMKTDPTRTFTMLRYSQSRKRPQIDRCTVRVTSTTPFGFRVDVKVALTDVALLDDALLELERRARKVLGAKRARLKSTPAVARSLAVKAFNRAETSAASDLLVTKMFMRIVMLLGDGSSNSGTEPVATPLAKVESRVRMYTSSAAKRRRRLPRSTRDSRRRAAGASSLEGALVAEADRAVVDEAVETRDVDGVGFTADADADPNPTA